MQIEDEDAQSQEQQLLQASYLEEPIARQEGFDENHFNIGQLLSQFDPDEDERDKWLLESISGYKAASTNTNIQ